MKHKQQAKGKEKQPEKAAAHRKLQIPFTRKNYIAFAVGLLVLIVGYILLAQPPADGFLSRTLAPVMLVLAYCVIFPYGIMARQRPKTE